MLIDLAYDNNLFGVKDAVHNVSNDVKDYFRNANNFRLRCYILIKLKYMISIQSLTRFNINSKS